MTRSRHLLRGASGQGKKNLAGRILRAEPLEPRMVLSAAAAWQQLVSPPLSSAASEANAPGPSASPAMVSAVVKATAIGLRDPGLVKLVQSLDADGSISRNDMLAIFRSSYATTNGVVTSTDLADLRTIVSNAVGLGMPGYVRVLASNVVNGNRANGWYQGTTLGNLGAGNSAAKLNKLVGKWFLGADHPATGGYGYRTVAGPLFTAAGPTHLDEQQGYLGDCYLISALGTIADSSQAAIRNMFIDNGVDVRTGVHTWTVRFYANGVADYVTVDNKLPTDGSGYLVFQGYGSTTGNPKGLWIALAEKAYAQWNETGKEGRDGRNRYTSIEGGWMATVDAQVLGRYAASYNVYSASDQQTLINAVTNKMAVTIGTMQSYSYDGSLSYGLYGNHAYGVIGYNSTAKTFTLYNPWGVCQPTKALTWAELKTVCDGFAVANALGTRPIGAGVVLTATRPGLASRPVVQPMTAVHEAASSPDASGDSHQSQAVARLAAWAVDAALVQQTPPTHSDFLVSCAEVSSSAVVATRLTQPHSGRPSRTAVDFAALAVDDFFQTV